MANNNKEFIKSMYRYTLALSAFSALVVFLSPILQRVSDKGYEPMLASIFWSVSFVFLIRHWRQKKAKKLLKQTQELARWNSLSESEKQTELMLRMRGESIFAVSGQVITGFFHAVICFTIFAFSIALPAVILERTLGQ